MLTIDPKLFTQGQWEEAAATDGNNLLKTDSHRQAKPVKASKKKVLEFAADCRAKAERVAAGELGETDTDVNIEAWSDELIAVAEILERIAGVIPPQRKTRISLDAEELATVLAALRLFQREYEDFSGDAIREEFPDHFEGIEPLGTDDIDTLCERINV